MKFYTRQHQYYCGIDLHARTMYVCIIDKDQPFPGASTYLYLRMPLSPQENYPFGFAQGRP